MNKLKRVLRDLNIGTDESDTGDDRYYIEKGDFNTSCNLKLLKNNGIIDIQFPLAQLIQ